MNFPKRYKIEYIQQLQREFQEDHPYKADAYSIFVLPAVQNLHLGHFYGLFLKDFFTKAREKKKQIRFKHGVIFQWKSLLSTSDAQKFFAKREQTLLQVGVNKLRKYLYAQKEKGTMINKKLLSLYFGDFIEAFEDHPDFSYFAQTTFRQLWKDGKLRMKKNIAYWSVDLQTTVHSHYVVFKPTQGKRYTIKYFIESRNEMLPTCASIPDMIFGDVALLVHP
jgi:valyl-tRNA synthetase